MPAKDRPISRRSRRRRAARQDGVAAKSGPSTTGTPVSWRRWLRGSGSMDWAAAALPSCAVLVAVSVGLFGPFDIYAPNQDEFDTSFAQVLPLLLGMCLLLAVALWLAGRLLPSVWRSRYVAALLATGCLLWIQGSFLRWDYGELDGRGIDWSVFRWQGWLDASVWVLLLGLAIVWHRRVARHAMFVAVVMLCLQGGSMLLRALTQEAEDLPGDATEAAVLPAEAENVPPGLCQVSRSRNIFHFILDSFQTDLFLELVHEEGLATDLRGFTLYKENMAVATRTVLCVPAIFSGHVYDGSVSESRYYRSAIESGFQNVLFKNNFVVNLIPYLGMKGTRASQYFISPKTYATSQTQKLLRNASFLADLSLFRQLPHHVKRLVHNDETWALSSLVGHPPSHISFHQKAFFDDYIDKLEASHSRPAYHFVHLMPPHPPYVTLENGEPAAGALPKTRENFKYECRAILSLFMKFLARLREMDIYDSSTILLQGDHGAGFDPVFAGEEFPMPQKRVPALLVLKPADTSKRFSVSTAQTSIADIPATILDLAQVPHDYPGVSIAGLTEDLSRAREFIVVKDRHTNRPQLRRWLVEGSIYEPASWRETRAERLEREIESYTWGQTLSFGITGNGDAYLTHGWSTTSPTLHWNHTTMAEMTMRVPRPDNDVEIYLRFFGHAIAGIGQQRIRVLVNRHAVDEISFTESESYGLRFTVPKERFESGIMKIVFSFPTAVSPAKAGTGSETRPLAMGLYEFVATLVE